MKLNLIFVVLWAILGLAALIVAIFCNASWHFFTAVVCFLLACALWNDNVHGNESVKSYFAKKARKNKQ